MSEQCDCPICQMARMIEEKIASGEIVPVVIRIAGTIEDPKDNGLNFFATLIDELIAEVERLQQCQHSLARLQERHSTLIHMLNDAAMFANELHEATDCGRGK